MDASGPWVSGAGACTRKGLPQWFLVAACGCQHPGTWAWNSKWQGALPSVEGPVWGGGLFLEELSLRCHEMWGGGEGTQWVPCPSSPSTLVGPAHSGGGLPLWLQHREPGSWWGCWPHQPSPQRRKTSWAVRVGLDSPRRQGGEQGLPMSCHPRGRAWPAVSQMPTGSQPASRLRVLWVAGWCPSIEPGVLTWCALVPVPVGGPTPMGPPRWVVILRHLCVLGHSAVPWTPQLELAFEGSEGTWLWACQEVAFRLLEARPALGGDLQKADIPSAGGKQAGEGQASLYPPHPVTAFPPSPDSWGPLLDAA